MTQHDSGLEFLYLYQGDQTLIYNPNLSFISASDKEKLSQNFEGVVAPNGPKP
jgi:hypothetical protein